jgi:hypothetical protein
MPEKRRVCHAYTPNHFIPIEIEMMKKIEIKISSKNERVWVLGMVSA